MEEVHAVASAYYSKLAKKQKDLATKFFKSMDRDGNGIISRREFADYFKKKGLTELIYPDFFNKLDKDGNDTLDFKEFITVFYINQSGRTIFCRECRAFLTGTYFSCVQCFCGSGETFDLCSACYRDKDIYHHKDAVFLDNYALLRSRRPNIQDSTACKSQNKEGADVFTVLTSMESFIAHVAPEFLETANGAIESAESCNIM